MKRFAPIVLFVALFACTAAPVYAATISFSPTTLSVTAGETFSLQVMVNAQGSPVVTSQFQLSYPQNILEPVSFTFAPNWIQTLDPGTNVMGSGTIVQAGGYSATFSGVQPMGTLTFTAQKAGVVTLNISEDNSYIFKTDGGNLLTGPLGSAHITIISATNDTNTENSAAIEAEASALGAISNPNGTSPTSTVSTTTLNSFLYDSIGVIIFAVFIVGLWRIYPFFKRKGKRKHR